MKNREKANQPDLKTARKIVTILGVGVDSTPPGGLLKSVRTYITRSKANRAYLIVTPNPEIIVQAQKDKELASILNNAELSLPDGMGLIWAAQGRLKERITGIDFAEDLIRVATEENLKVFFLGGKKGVAKAAAANFSRRYNLGVERYSYRSGPALDNSGVPETEKDKKEEKETVESIKRFKPHLLLVGFGAPKQEKWLGRNLDKLSVNVAMTVGGALDFWSGRISRAPKIVRQMGLEWLWRLAIEPKRIKRILKAVVIFPLLILKERIVGIGDVLKDRV